MRTRIIRGLGTVSAKALGVTIILTLVLAPLPPFSNPRPAEDVQTAKEIYESSDNVPAPVVARYRADEPVPEFVPSAPDPVLASEPAPIVAGVSLDAPVASSSEKAVVAVAKKPRAVRSYVPETVIAAEQVAKGLSASEIVEVALDANANIVETVDTHGAKTTAEYNDAGDPVKIVSPDGTITYYAYDSEGNLTSIYDEKPAKVVAFSWQSPIASILAYISSSARVLAGEGAAQNTAIAYDAGNLTEVADGQGAVEYEYDEFGNLSAETNTEGEYTVYEYDEFGNITGKEVVTPVTSEAVSSVTRFLARVHLEDLSRFIARVYADEEEIAQEESFGYDDRNNLEAFAVSVTGIAPAFTAPEPAPIAATSTPVIEEAIPVAPQASSTAEVPVTEGAPAPAVQEAGSEMPAAEVVPAPVPSEASVEVPVNAIQEVVSFLAAPFRAILALAAPLMARALAEEVVEVLPEATAAGESIVVWNTRDALDNLTETENEKGEVTTYRYDAKADALVGKTVTSAQGSVLSDISYGFDSARWTSRTEDGRTESYEYDDRGQLTGGTGAYAYDEHGNRLSSQDSHGNGSYAYEGNRLLSLVRGDATKSYEYDENGNVVAIRDSEKGATTLSYTGRGAIAGIALPDGTSIRYTYDALNRRIEKSVGNRIERYQYEGKNLTRVLNENGTVLRQYVYDPKGALIAIIRDQAVYSVILDAKGSVVALTDSRSEVVARFSYDAWGTPQSTDTGLTDFYFASGYYEAEAGLYILGPRTYDPSIGRFLQKDPLAGSLLDLVSQNEYVYANNDPVNKIDPTGHRAEIASVGQSAKAIAANARSAARQMSAVISEKKKEIADLEADPLSSPDDLLAAQEALRAALEAKDAMLELAKNNEEEVARREARETEEALLDAAWQASLQSVAAPATEPEATTTSEIVPNVEAVPIEVPVENPEPPIVEDSGPVSFLRDASGFVSESLYKLVPKAEAKKKKSKAKKNPPPKKKKAKEKAPKKLSKAEQRKQEKEEKEAKALKDLKSTSKAQAAAAVLAATQKKGSAPVPSTAAVSQGMKQQMSTLSVAPSVATTKTSSATKLVSAPSTAKVPQTSVSLIASISAQAEKLAKDIAAVRAKQAIENARAVALAAQLAANGKAKVTPVVNSPLVKNAQYGLAACSFEPAIVGGTCGLIDGVLYVLQGNGTSAGLSFAGALPLGAGLAYDATKSGRLIEQGTKISKVSATSLKISNVRLTDLKPTHYLDKSRKDMQELVDDVRINGVRESIKYIEEDGVKYIVDGHHRYFAALKVGVKEVPAEKVTYPYAGYSSVSDLVLEGKMPGYWQFIK